MLRAPITADPGLVAPSARDEFNQTAGALTAKTAPVGGAWAGAGDTDDFSVETTGKTAQRTAVSDGGTVPSQGRFAIAGTTTFTNVACAVDFKRNALAGHSGVVVRYTDPSNLLVVGHEAATNLIWVYVMVAGADSGIQVPGPALAVDTWYRLAVVADANGRVSVFLGARDSLLARVVQFASSHLATGGTLASGKCGFWDQYTSAAALARNYDNFAAWVPTQNAVLYPNQSAELRWDGMVREDSTGIAYGSVSWVTGDLPRLPPTVEGSTTEVFLKLSRGDFDQLPDDGIDDVSARITYRPCWLTVPGS